MLEIHVRDYPRYVKDTLGLAAAIEALRDQRQRPPIPAPVVFEAVLYGVSFGLESLSVIDTFVRTRDRGSVLGLERGPLLSDSTMERSLRGMKPAPVAALMGPAARAVLERPEFKEAGRIGDFRVAIVDKSTLAGRPVVVCRLAGTLWRGYLAPEERRQGKRRSKKQPVKSVMRELAVSVPALPVCRRQTRHTLLKKELRRQRTPRFSRTSVGRACPATVSPLPSGRPRAPQTSCAAFLGSLRSGPLVG